MAGSNQLHRVRVEAQVGLFRESWGLDHRRIFKRALAGLKNESGDIKALGDDLAGFYRLRIGAFRVIFRYQPRRVIECVYANRRGLVYDVFEREMIERLK